MILLMWILLWTSSPTSSHRIPWCTPTAPSETKVMPHWAGALDVSITLAHGNTSCYIKIYILRFTSCESVNFNTEVKHFFWTQMRSFVAEWGDGHTTKNHKIQQLRLASTQFIVKVWCWEFFSFGSCCMWTGCFLYKCLLNPGTKISRRHFQLLKRKRRRPWQWR